MKFITLFQVEWLEMFIHVSISVQNDYKMYILSVLNNSNCVLEFSTLVGKLLWFWTYNHKLSCGIDWMCMSPQASSLSSDRQELRTSRKCLVHLCGSIHPRYPCLRIPDGRKTVILGNFSNLGLPYPEGQPLYRQGPNLVCHTVRSQAEFCLDRPILLHLGGKKNPNFTGFGVRHFVMSPIGGV